jgi:hypothetical protein
MTSQPDNAAPALVHDVPFPTFMRWAFAAIGLFAVITPAYELGRGVWPLTVVSPFFAFIILGAWSIGFAMLGAALFGHAALLEFRPGELRVRQSSPFKTRELVFALSAIVSMDVKETESSDGPNQWGVEIKTGNGQVFRSRTYDTEATARKTLAEFRSALES